MIRLKNLRPDTSHPAFRRDAFFSHNCGGLSSASRTFFDEREMTLETVLRFSACSRGSILLWVTFTLYPRTVSSPTAVVISIPAVFGGKQSSNVCFHEPFNFLPDGFRF